MRARIGRTLFTGILVATFALHVSSAFAQDGLVPPQLTQGATPEYPASKRATAEAASVVLTLTIGADGAVQNVDVATSAGPEFDASAIEAAKKLVFAAATRNGKPIVARIPYRFDFAVQPEAPAPVAAPVLEGRVLNAQDEPLAGATVKATGSDGKVVTLTTGADGSFRFNDLPAGSYTLETLAEGYEPFGSREELVAGEAATVTYRPKVAAAPTDANAPQEIRVVGDRPPREVTRRPISAQEVARIPGSNGDALRAVENMPGVARPPGFAGLLIVRGSAPQDTGIFVDGTQVPIAFHFGGVSSVVPSGVLERIDFLPGNFGPEYGRSMGGNIDIGLRSPAKDRFHGMAQVDLLDARFLVEAPLGDKTRFLLAGRRSHLDAWIGGVMEAGGAVGVRTAPRYYDYQAILERDIGSHTTARLALFGSDDALKLTLNSAGNDPAESGNFDSATQFYRVQGRVDTRLSDKTRWINTVSYGRDMNRFAVGNNLSFKVVTNPLTVRSDLRTTITDHLTAIGGVDTVWTTVNADVVAPPIAEDDQAGGPVFARQSKRMSLDGSVFQPGAYGMLEIAPVKSLKLLPSVRGDYSSAIKEWNVSPRFAARWDVPTGWRRTTLKGGVGFYHQPPQPYESLAPFGTPNLKNNRAVHTSLGVEQELSQQVELSVEGFYKKLDNLVDQRANALGSGAGVDYVNSGSGRIYGGELLLRYKPDARFFGWVAYTLSRSERRADDTEAYRTFEFDQTHILTALGSWKLGKGWELGARWRYVTGNPYTPAASAIYDADAGAYSPVNATPFSGRDSAFHRLDVRIDKTWTFKSWKLGAYLDLQNSYFRNNAEGRNYNYNYARSTAVSGLPVLPIIGLRGEL
jgi:TonB family protein